jgi:hypothetical protein
MTNRSPMDHYTKAVIVRAVRHGAMTRSAVYRKYDLSAAELRHWEMTYDHEGIAGLRARALSAQRRAGNE